MTGVDLRALECKSSAAKMAREEYNSSPDETTQETAAWYRAERAERDYWQAAQPPVTLALIARIRELESGLTEAAGMVDTCVAMGSWSSIGMEFDRLRALVAKGIP